MAIDKSIYVPLFTELSATTESPFFHVFPGQIAMLQAFGFQEFKSRVDKTELQQPQQACLEQLLFKEELVFPDRACQVGSLDNYQTLLLDIDTMRLNGCVFTLSKCNNIMLLNIPGSYRFVLNDGTAVGNARIFFRIMSKDEFPWNSKFFIGA